jgi:hypothetical protein
MMSKKRAPPVEDGGNLGIDFTYHAERSHQKRRLRSQANRGTVNQLRLKAEPTKWNRRASYEMDIDEWDNINEETQKMELADRLGIPVEDLQSIRRSGSTIQVTFDLRNALLHAHRKPLYKDVGDDGNSGVLYGGHPSHLEPDTYLGPYWPAKHTKELARAETLSYKPIQDAPPAYMDLPWKELLDPKHMITIEELLVYFPNHVARWPGLAAALRWSNLDRLFYRAARIINLARGSHQSLCREDQHTEVLPLQMKIERAIREIDPGYRLFDFPHENYTPEAINAHLWQRPCGQGEQQDLVCTLQEAAGYITGINEFEAHRPFSQYMKRFQPRSKYVTPRSIPEHSGGLGSMKAYSRYQTATGDAVTGRPAQMDQEPSEVCHEPDCDILGCDKVHTTSKTSKYRGGAQKQTSSQDKQVVFAADTTVGERSRNGSRNKNDTNPPFPAQGCNQGAACHKKDCILGHPGPWTDTNVQLNLSNFQVHCKQQARCTDRECNRSHKSWAWIYESKGPVGNTNGTNGQVHRAPWQRACSFETRPDGCKNVKCAFGHRGPKTVSDVQLEFEQYARCPWDRECRNKRCDQAHSSPATEGSTGASGGGGRGAESGSGSSRGSGVPRGPKLPGGRGRGRWTGH